MTELAAPQISSLMEALPGIAAVLRSPVANAMVAISRAAAGLEEFQLAHAEELLRFGVRRNLLTQEEVDAVLGELRTVMSGRPQPKVPPVDKAKKVVVPVKPVDKPPPQRPKPLQLRSSSKMVPRKPLKPLIKPKPKPAPIKKPVLVKPVVKKKPVKKVLPPRR